MRTELPRQKGQEQGAVRGPSAIAEFWSSPPTRAAPRREEAGRDLGRDPGRPDPHDGPEAPFSWEDPRASGSGRGSDPWSLGMPGSGLGRTGDSLHGQHLASPPACETSQEVWNQLCPQERPMIREFSPLGVEAAGSLSTGNAA